MDDTTDNIGAQIKRQIAEFAQALANEHEVMIREISIDRIDTIAPMDEDCRFVVAEISINMSA